MYPPFMFFNLKFRLKISFFTYEEMEVLVSISFKMTNLIKIYHAVNQYSVLSAPTIRERVGVGGFQILFTFFWT